MKDQNDGFDLKPKNMFVSIGVTQAVCIAVLLISILIIKFFFFGSFENLQQWCRNNVLEETQITQVFDGETSGEI